jgi:hypothetical protein
MTLLEAYRALGPTVGNDAIDRVRSEAARILLGEAQRICRRLPFPDDLKEELPNRLLLKLVRGAVGGKRWRDPDSDGGVVGFLVKSLKRAALDEIRRRQSRHKAEVESVEVTAQRSGATLSQEDAAEAEATWSQLMDEIVQGAAGVLPEAYQAGLVRAASEMLALAKGETTIEVVVARQDREPGAKSESAVYQQHHRARARLLSHIDQLHASGELTPERAEHLRNAVRSLKRRAFES